MRLLGFIAAIGFAGLMGGCSVNPVTGEQQFTLMSASQEVAIGTRQYAPSQQSQGGRYSVDPDLNLYVSQVGHKLAAVSQRPNLPYEFVVLNNDVPNAWALPGGKIAINRGLLMEMEDEAQLASVLAHEIVHAAARHSASQMTQQMLLGLGSQFLTIAGKNTGYGDLINTGAQMGSALVLAQYGQDHELESDYYGMEYMALAGYEPQAAVELQQTFVRLSEGRQSDWLSGLFASHPPSQTRVVANQRKAEQLPSGKRNRATYQRAIAQIKRDAGAYKTHQEAIKAANDKDVDRALSLVQQAINKQPKEHLFWVTKGQLHMNKNHFKSASTAFSKAISLDPEYFMSYLGRGLSAKELGRTETATQDLQQSLTLLPTQMASFHLGELMEGQGDYRSAVEYYNKATQGGGELGQKAAKRIQDIMQPQQNKQQNR
ncbi:M48 family metallopeptidase [Maricurvus nonylphenolicus]|uniref:M48 family metalloprotease n=1 Tax=Maricurvus nonylphenolicus TaxID=1008307 RepID=UPI0036F26B3A